MVKEQVVLEVPRYQQPDDTTCGPTCLAQVYAYYGHREPIVDVITATPRNPDGGTLGVNLGLVALESGYCVTLYSYNLRVFDPTWFELPRHQLVRKLVARRQTVRSEKLRRAIDAYSDFLERGGEIRFDLLAGELIASILADGKPIITGLSATYLYRTPRELDDEYDDVRGLPAGHFVVINGHDPETGSFLVTDPSPHAPFGESGRYAVESGRLIASILLGDLTYDAVLLVLNRGRPARSM